MKYSENGFRYFYHKICGFPLKYSLHKILEDAGRSDLACHNFLMTYCYIDPDEGVMFRYWQEHTSSMISTFLRMLSRQNTFLFL